MDLNELRDRAYKTACDHGFHDAELSDAHCLMLVITEIAEAVQADRKGRHANAETFKRVNNAALDCFEPFFVSYIKDTFEDELADICIRLLDFAGLFKLDIKEIKPETRYTKSTAFTRFSFELCTIMTNPTYTAEHIVNLCIANISYYCELNGIDLSWHIGQKMKYNELRPYRHDRKY